jgi:hypothetical protein
MSVRLVGGGSNDLAVSGSTPARAPSGIRASAPAVRASAATQASADISREAEMLEHLSALRSSEPARFKIVSNEITSKLKSEAGAQSGDMGSKLDDLAAKFAEAARTGDMSSLRPASRSSNAPARGAEAYRQTARRAPASSDVEQLISDALKDMSRRSA